MTARLPAWSLYAALIAMAGLPIYIHAPKVYADQYGVPLASLGLTLAALRLIDVVQDPALGWLAERTRRHRQTGTTLATLLMALSLAGLGLLLLWALVGAVCFLAEPVAPSTSEVSSP